MENEIAETIEIRKVEDGGFWVTHYPSEGRASEYAFETFEKMMGFLEQCWAPLPEALPAPERLTDAEISEGLKVLE